MCWTYFESIGNSLKFGPLSENSLPTLVPQAGYGPGSIYFPDYAPVLDACLSHLIQ